MPRSIVECVPNFSEGRRPDVLDALAAGVRGPGIRLLDVSADPDHNRAVFTFVGEGEAVLEAAFRSAAVAVERIDLRAHQGVHPRIGAVDVIPFVPLAGGSMPACVKLARRLGALLADRLGLPVYLYGEAEGRRRTLAEIRRGEFEGLRTAIAKPERHPDFGPARIHPSAGAVAVGARGVLIAFNVNLNSADAAPAREIARAVRASSGGLPAVQAMGVPLRSRGLAQVSMNLLDYRLTPPLAALRRVEEEAAHRGIGVVDSELVGCAPREALPSDPAAALRLRGLRPEQILDPAAPQ
ncbi:MAG: glutamate formimidoyltransferase [Bacillati bacterium ANGP1]|uniref:glutamate formimidoyltransferase n=1 Tax=Candidatus Segetimicrobium genomatis TaxID=2569760 RepID=A0A537J763_9BACT|nr:MAG: glutamate formimidoyltransferase [Terrabacteria group bacterium ANGP1]